MCTEVEVVAGVAPTERSLVAARPCRPVPVAETGGEVPGAHAARHAHTPRDVYSVAYYVQKFREVGHGWDHAE